MEEKDVFDVPMKPIGPRFIAVKHEPEEVTDGGIHLPNKARDNEKKQQPEAIIVRASEALTEAHGDLVSPGTKVLLGVIPQEFRCNGHDYIIVDWAMVKAVYES